MRGRLIIIGRKREERASGPYFSEPSWFMNVKERKGNMLVGPTWQYDKEDITSDAQDVLRELVLKTYSDPNVFIRELAQNAKGANATELHITMTVAQEDPSRVIWLTVQDNGDGMDETDIRAYLSCLGHSNNPLGQFGVGFFSTLATSDYVEICSKKKGKLLHGSQPVRAAYWRVYDDEGTAIIEHGVGKVDDGFLASCGLANSPGTAVRIKFPYFGRRTQQDAKAAISNAVNQWCKYLEIRIFLGDEFLPSAVDLPCRVKIKFEEKVIYKDPVANAERTLPVSGALGVSDQTDVKLLQNHLFIQQTNLVHGGTYVNHVSGFINCDAFEVAAARTAIINNAGQASGAIYAAVIGRATLFVERLFEQVVTLQEWKDCEKNFVKERIWGYYKEKGNAELPNDQKAVRGGHNLIQNPELMKRVVWLKSLAGPGDTSNPAFAKEVTIFDIWQVLQAQKKIFWAARPDQIVEDLARDGNLVISQSEVNNELVQALVKITSGASVQSAEGQEKAEQFKTLTATSAQQQAFLAICQFLDPAVVLVEPIVRDDPRTIWVQGYYRVASGEKSEEIGINVLNPFVANVIAQCVTDPIMAGVRIFHTIIHERNHQTKPAHNDEFLRALEPLLDDKIGPWLDTLRKNYT